MLCAWVIAPCHAPRNTCFVADGSLLLGDGGVAGGDGGAEPAGSGKGLMAVIGVPANWAKAARATATALVCLDALGFSGGEFGLGARGFGAGAEFGIY